MINKNLKNFVLNILDSGNFKKFIGDAFMHIAVDMHDFVIVDKLIRAGCNIDLPNEHGYSPLHLAVFNGDIKMARLLLLNGANVNEICFVTYETPLHFACTLGDIELINLLIDYGGDINMATRNKISALEQLLISGHDKVFLGLFNEIKLTKSCIATKVFIGCLHIAITKNMKEVSNFIKSILGVVPN